MTRLVIIDTETTGNRPGCDQIIEFTAQFGLTGNDQTTFRIKPTIAIHPQAEALHGITAERLDGEPPFETCAFRIAGILSEADVIVGYNVQFDLDMLASDFARVGVTMPDLSGKHIVDALRLWQQCEPRTLSAAHEKFCGGSFDDAHSGGADVAATGRVLEALLRVFALGDLTWEELALRSDPQRATWVGPSRHMQWQNGAVVFSFGKHRGVPLHELAKSEPGFLRWVVSKDFPPHVKEVCGAALRLNRDAFLADVASKHPQPRSQPP